MNHYILDGDGNPVLEPDLVKWFGWMSSVVTDDYDGLRVAFDARGGVEVSTVFLGVDHNLSSGVPLLFETMVFGVDIIARAQWRYATRQEALDGHRRACELVLPKEVTG